MLLLHPTTRTHQLGLQVLDLPLRVPAVPRRLQQLLLLPLALALAAATQTCTHMVDEHTPDGWIASTEPRGDVQEEAAQRRRRWRTAKTLTNLCLSHRLEK